MTVAAPDIIGNSPLLLEAKAPALRVAPTSYSVIIYGESGTGKELFARLIHARSPRAAGPFVAVNCGAIPRELAESELFGHERGAFTGAGTARPGHFERASGGTLFLDEIGDLPLDQQVKILRALQEGEVLPVGATRSRRVDVRIVSATNRDLWNQVQEGDFREDLFYRLSGFEITLPPLRDRGRDVIALAKMILEAEEAHRHMSLSRGAERLLLEYGWPGNIRELQNVVRRAALYAIQGRIPEDAVRSSLRFPTVRELSNEQLREQTMDQIRRQKRSTESSLRSVLKVSRYRNQKVLDELEAAELIERHGVGTGTYYTAAGDPRGDGLTRRQRLALRHVEATGAITRAEYEQVTGTTERTARRELADLVDKGILRIRGRGRAVKYVLATDRRS